MGECGLWVAFGLSRLEVGVRRQSGHLDQTPTVVRTAFRSCSSRRVVEVPLARPDSPATMQEDTPLGHRRAPFCSAAPHGNALLSRACFVFFRCVFFTGSDVPRGRATTMP